MCIRDRFWAWAETWRTKKFKGWNIENFLPQIKCPSLIIQGEKDEYGTLLQVERIITQTKGKSIKHILPNVYHTPHKEVPEPILNIAANFIKELINKQNV